MWMMSVLLSAALAQEPPPKPPDLPSPGDPETKVGPGDYDESSESCNGTVITGVYKKAFTIVGTTGGGQFESEIARHTCNQACKGASHQECTPGSCYTKHTHDEGLTLKWDQTKTQEVTTKISASIKAKLPGGASIGAAVEEEIKKMISTATSAEQKLRGCEAEACSTRTEAGGWLLLVNPGKVVITGYYVYTDQYTCGSVGHWAYPDCWYCTLDRFLARWRTIEITGIEFQGGANMTFTKWLVPGSSCACKPEHRIPTGDDKHSRLDRSDGEYQVAVTITVTPGEHESLPAGTKIQVRRDERTPVRVGDVLYTVTALGGLRGFNDATSLEHGTGKAIYEGQPTAFTGRGPKDSFVYLEANGKAVELDPILAKDGEVVYATPRTPAALADAREIQATQMSGDLKTLSEGRIANGRLVISADPEVIGPNQVASIMANMLNPEAIDPAKKYLVRLAVKGNDVRFADGRTSKERVMTGADLRAGVRDQVRSGARASGPCDVGGTYYEVLP